MVLRDVPEPKIRDNEVLIKVRRAGVCGTDVHIYDWDDWARGRCKPPFVVGHEFAGDVVEVGRLVTYVLTRKSSASIAMDASPSISRCPRQTCGISLIRSAMTSVAFTIRWEMHF